jgi:hypothetical protein
VKCRWVDLESHIGMLSIIGESGGAPVRSPTSLV